ELFPVDIDSVDHVKVAVQQVKENPVFAGPDSALLVPFGVPANDDAGAPAVLQVQQRVPGHRVLQRRYFVALHVYRIDSAEGRVSQHHVVFPNQERLGGILLEHLAVAQLVQVFAAGAVNFVDRAHVPVGRRDCQHSVAGAGLKKRVVLLALGAVGLLVERKPASEPGQRRGRAVLLQHNRRARAQREVGLVFVQLDNLGKHVF
nr:hypothetical protein [Tanacetum cinerariifolium]